MRELLSGFDYLRAFWLGSILSLVQYILVSPLIRLWNLAITPLEIMPVTTAVTILNAFTAVSMCATLVLVSVLYFRKSKYSIPHALMLGAIFALCASVWLWVENLLSTLLSSAGIVYGGGIGISGAVMLLLAPLVVMTVVSFFGVRARP